MSEIHKNENYEIKRQIKYLDCWLFDLFGINQIFELFIKSTDPVKLKKYALFFILFCTKNEHIY